MNIKNILEKYPQIKSYLLPLSIGILGFIFLLFGILNAFIQHPKEAISFENTQVDSITKLPTKKNIIDISGAVNKPGMYELPVDARVQDGITIAGGLSDQADRDFIEKHINLAAKLVDGGKVYIPKRGDKQQMVSTNQQGQTSFQDQSGILNINEASMDQLDSLPGIGKITAQKIITGRPYSDIEDLLKKKVVSTKVFNGIKDKISLY